jgi:hypothetical protein
MEKRRLQRTKIRHSGKVFGGGETVHVCTVHNVTGLGVCIEFAFHADELPAPWISASTTSEPYTAAKLFGVKAILQALLFESFPSLRSRSIFAVGRN